MEGNSGLFERLLLVFMEEFDGLQERLANLLATDLDADTIKEAGRLVHSLRGAAMQIGALELAQAAAALEHTLHHDARRSPSKLAAMSQLLGDLMDSLQKHRGKG
jgi:chemotaxis protein histidine kinase CheA